MMPAFYRAVMLMLAAFAINGISPLWLMIAMFFLSAFRGAARHMILFPDGWLAGMLLHLPVPVFTLLLRLGE